MKYYVLTWEYYDHSAFKVVRVYPETQLPRAQEDLALVKDTGDGKEWELHKIDGLNV